MCLTCHPEEAGWRGTMHATGLKELADDTYSLRQGFGVVADSDGNGVDDFKQGLDLGVASSQFVQYGKYAPVLGYDPDSGYTIRIGAVTYPVRFAYGGSGSYRQVYGVKIPVSDRGDRTSAGYYISPVQYNELTHQYSVFQPESWYNDDGTPKLGPATVTSQLPASASFERSCAGCHFTSIEVSRDGSEWVASAPPTVQYFEGDPHYIDFNGDGFKELTNVGCERCHGPGSRHVLASGGRDTIINPARDFNAQQANELCGSCHTAGKSRGSGLLDYPFDEQVWQPYAVNLGESLFNRFLFNLPAMWPDGKESAGYHQQLQEIGGSSKWSAGVRCSDCHDVHINTPNQIRPVMRVPDSFGNPIDVPVAVNDNTQCLACHAGRDDFSRLRPEDLLDLDSNGELIAREVSAHTHHDYDPEGSIGFSRCTECHMPKMAVNAIPYDTASHSFRAVPPEKTIELARRGGMPNSCAVRCHRQWAPVFGLPADEHVTDWREAADLTLAEWLETYYGLGGIWWNTLVPSPATVTRSGSHRVGRASLGGSR